MAVMIYMLGVLSGMALVMIYGTYQMIRLEAKKKLLIKNLKNKVQTDNTEAINKADLKTEQAHSIKARLIEATAIAEQQSELRAMAEAPSKNSLHSRHKNGLIMQLQELEAQKISILKTILAEGFDPIITLFREGGVKEEIPLSSYVMQAEDTLNALLPPAPPESSYESGGPRKAGKFIIYTGGKNDDDGTTH